MKSIYKKWLYLTPAILTLSVIAVNVAKNEHEIVHSVGGVPIENVVEGIVPILLCIIFTVVCYISIRKKFANDNVEIKNIRIKSVLLVLLNILIIVLGISFVVMYINS